MPSHLSSIGFPVHSHEDFQKIAEQAIEEGQQIPSANGSYILWSSESGAQLWLQLDNDNSFIGFMPYFSGQSYMKLALTQAIERDESEGSILEGMFRGWVNPHPSGLIEGEYPLIIDIPDFDNYRTIQLPLVVDMQVTAFAYDIEIFPSDEAYYESQDHEMKIASEAVIPIGLLTMNVEDLAQQDQDDESLYAGSQAEAAISGHVIKTRCLTNQITNEKFHWALIQTLGGTIDVVLDSELAEGLEIGSVIYGVFWVCGRIIYYQ